MGDEKQWWRDDWVERHDRSQREDRGEWVRRSPEDRREIWNSEWFQAAFAEEFPLLGAAMAEAKEKVAAKEERRRNRWKRGRK